MSWVGDLFKFEKSKLSDMWGRAKDNPEQLLIGAGDPFSAKVWSGITGKDYEPFVDQMGGATGQDFNSAEDKGIDTKAGRQMHGLAHVIAAMFAGGYGMNALGGAGGASGGAAGSSSTGSAFIPGADSAASGYGFSSTAPSSVNLTNAGGTMNTGSSAGGLSSMDKSALMRQFASKGLMQPSQTNSQLDTTPYRPMNGGYLPGGRWFNPNGDNNG